ncbi:MAG: GNAT family N-acetyltransferase [Halioglobus sp.]|nr:GNAT family N-acetyltransferase [Halioglobus sp.]
MTLSDAHNADVGTVWELQPVLSGSTIVLRPLKEDDFEALHEAASDPKIWEMHPDSERYQKEVFRENFFDGAISSRGALVIEEFITGRTIGSSRYYKWRPETKEISIGYTFLERKYWGIGTNRELKNLMLSHIFQWAEVVWFHVGKDNMRSRRAVEKLGAVLFEQESRVFEGKPYIQLFYRLDNSDFSVGA